MDIVEGFQFCPFFTLPLLHCGPQLSIQDESVRQPSQSRGHIRLCGSCCAIISWTDRKVGRRDRHRCQVRKCQPFPWDSIRFTAVSPSRSRRPRCLTNICRRTGSRRFRLPEPIPPYATSFSATAYGPSCPQQAIELPLVDGLAGEAVNYIVNSIFGQIFPDDEDCKSGYIYWKLC